MKFHGKFPWFGKKRKYRRGIPREKVVFKTRDCFPSFKPQNFLREQEDSPVDNHSFTKEFSTLQTPSLDWRKRVTAATAGTANKTVKIKGDDRDFVIFMATLTHSRTDKEWRRIVDLIDKRCLLCDFEANCWAREGDDGRQIEFAGCLLMRWLVSSCSSTAHGDHQLWLELC